MGQQDAQALRYVAPWVLGDRAFVLEAVRANPESLRHVANLARGASTPDVVHSFLEVAREGLIFRHALDRPDERVAGALLRLGSLLSEGGLSFPPAVLIAWLREPEGRPSSFNMFRIRCCVKELFSLRGDLGVACSEELACIALEDDPHASSFAVDILIDICREVPGALPSDSPEACRTCLVVGAATADRLAHSDRALRSEAAPLCVQMMEQLRLSMDTMSPEAAMGERKDRISAALQAAAWHAAAFPVPLRTAAPLALAVSREATEVLPSESEALESAACDPREDPAVAAAEVFFQHTVAMLEQQAPPTCRHRAYLAEAQVIGLHPEELGRPGASVEDGDWPPPSPEKQHLLLARLAAAQLFRPSGCAESVAECVPVSGSGPGDALLSMNERPQADVSEVLVEQVVDLGALEGDTTWRSSLLPWCSCRALCR